ncbi:MAG: N-acetylmuramoyl-L-alanine amidase, partial [Candidatus Riflebacteria bacterium]|nr:N-acetylmuramoyl-L-alanine amidase [Candidatus Riflebacteria bacterium]
MKNYKKLAFLFLLSTFPAFAQGYKPLEGLNIMLDPGHGGADPGAVGRLGLKESDTNLRVARYLRMLLEHDGANVTLTRETPEKTLSLAQRVAMSNKSMPDLFISIHHNASLNPKPTNHSEIYYKSVDKGVSRFVGEHLNNGLYEAKYAGDSLIIPAGFYVLRNNDAPAILTEGSYISIPDSEKQLRSGKGLTKEAEILWRSIRKAYEKGAFKIDLYAGSEDKLVLDSPYFNILFTANKAVKTVNARVDNVKLGNLGVKSIMAYPMTYSLYNTLPLKSGEYELSISAESVDGLPAPSKKVNLVVALPINKVEMVPVAPYIPMGFKGRFPIDIKIYDEQNHINTRSAIAKLSYGSKTSEILTDASGISTAFIELEGTETKEVKVKLSVEDSKEIEVNLPIVMPIQRFVLGKLTGFNNIPLSGAKIKHNDKTIARTNENGLFYFAYPLTTNEFTIDVQPRFGHNNLVHTIKTYGEPVILPLLNAEPIAPALYNKKLAVMAPEHLNDMSRNLI